MIVKELLNKYDTKVYSEIEGFKPHFGDSGYYEIETKCMIPIYSYCFDGRRGIWINKFVDKEVMMIQIYAGREGDDAILTLVLNKEWFKDFVNKYNIDNIKEELINYVTLETDITDLVKGTIGCKGTNWSSKSVKIYEILELKDKGKI